jgi:hypothetical protein
MVFGFGSGKIAIKIIKSGKIWGGRKSNLENFSLLHLLPNPHGF